MNTSTVTIRLPIEQREALKRTAKALKKSESKYIRDLLNSALDSQPFVEPVKHLVGCVDSSQTIGEPHPLRELIQQRNWRK